jgi:hypothetical protein
MEDIMKKTIITLSLLLALAASSLAGSKKANEPVEPDPVEFANRLVAVFGGEDHVLDEKETIAVLSYLQKHLPEQTCPSGLSTRISREFNVRNTIRNAMTEERHALREYAPENYVARFIKKYDRNDDSVLTPHELTDAMARFMGLPTPETDWKKKRVIVIDE